MLIPLIVIGVLFLITWVVIGVSATPAAVEPGHNDHDHCPSYLVDPFHTCSYSRLSGEVDRLKSELGSLRYQIRSLDSRRPSKLDEMVEALGVKSPEQLLAELQGIDKEYPPKEIKFDKHTYKLDSK